jgi:dienelactone hydrolase
VRTAITVIIVLFLPQLSKALPLVDARNTDVYDYKSHFTPREYTSHKAWEARKSDLKAQILSAAGLLPAPARTPLRPQFVKRVDYPGYSIETVLIEPIPGYYLGGNLYRPTVAKGSRPGVLVPHGHWKRGRLEDQPSYSVPALAINLARQGYVVFAYDMVGFNDTRQTPHSFGNTTYELWSFTPLGLQLWNSIRALDFLESLPYVDSRRLAMTGASGGGSQTFLLTAVDDRIKVSAPVNMVSAYMQGGDPCEEAPSLRVGTFNVEIAAMAAPRPMLLVSSTHDWTRHTPEEEFPAIRNIYGLYGHADSVQNVHVNAEHNYNRESREAVYRFLSAHLEPGLGKSDLVDRDFEAPPDELLLAAQKKDQPLKESLGEVFQMWKVLGQLRVESGAGQSDVRTALQHVFNTEWPAHVDSRIERESHVVLGRTGKGDRITGRLINGKGSPVLIVHPEGAETALETPLARALLHAGRPVLTINAFVSSQKRAMLLVGDKYFLSYNRTDAAERVQDILTALQFLKSKYKGKPELIGLGDAGVRCVFAAALAPVPVELRADLNGFGGSDEDFLARFFVPGIQRAGGLSTAMRLVASLQAAMPANYAQGE